MMMVMMMMVGSEDRRCGSKEANRQPPVQTRVLDSMIRGAPCAPHNKSDELDNSDKGWTRMFLILRRVEVNKDAERM